MVSKHHYSFSRSKYFHLLIALIDGFITGLLDNEIDRKIDVTAMQFLLVQNRQQTHDWTLIGPGANGLGIQEWHKWLADFCSRDKEWDLKNSTFLRKICMLEIS